MNNHVKDYIQKRLIANKAILDHVKPENRPIIENVITELDGVLEAVNLVQSRTSKEPNLKEDEKFYK